MTIAMTIKVTFSEYFCDHDHLFISDCVYNCDTGLDMRVDAYLGRI